MLGNGQRVGFALCVPGAIAVLVFNQLDLRYLKPVAGFESTAEGESEFSSSIKVTQNKFTVYEKQYKDEAEKPEK